MGPTTVAVLDPLMKVIANEPLVNQALAESQLADLFESDMNVQTDQTNGGRYIELAHLFGLPGGVGARAEGDILPLSEDPISANSRVYLRSVYGTLEMSGHTMRRVMGSEGAFLDWADEAFPLFAKRLGHHLDRMTAGYGFGIIGRTTETFQGGGPYTVKLNRPYGVTGWTGVWRQLLEGDRLVFASTAAASSLRNAGTTQSAKVTNLDEDLDQATLEADAALAAAVQANDYIFLGDAAGHSGQVSGVNREPQGIIAAVDDGSILSTYLNLPRTTNRQWKGIIVDASDPAFGGNMSEDLLVYADEELTQRSGEKITDLVMSFPQARAYWKSLKTDRSLVNPRAYSGGKGPLSVLLTDREVALKVARKLPDEVVFGLTRSHWKKYMQGQWAWDDKTGSIWNRTIATAGPKDQFYAVGFTDLEVICKWPRSNFRIAGLTTVK